MTSSGGTSDGATSGRSDAPAPDVARWASGRHRYVDNLKVVLIAAVIVGHAILGYSEFDAWSYSDVREVSLASVTVIVLLAVVAPFGLLVIPLLFLVAGLLTPPSIERKGPGRFARDRLLRLGVPFVVFALAMWPLLEYALFRWLGNAPDLWTYLLAERSLDAGVLWFVGALLAFSLAYAVLVRVRGRPTRARPEPVRFAHLLMLAGAVTIATFLLRLAIPFESDNWFVDVNLWQWPAAAALFGLGVVAARGDWLAAVPDRLRRQSRTATLIAIGAAGLFALAIIVLGVDAEQLWGGWHWPALAFVAGESTLSVFGPVWLLAVAQRRLDRPFRWASPAARRSAYGAFLLQGPVLIGLSLALRPVPMVAEVKALIVAVGGVLASFALAWLLIDRVPGVARVL
ncbi:acyltransferase family protein [Agromyces bauzanensis]